MRTFQETSAREGLQNLSFLPVDGRPVETEKLRAKSDVCISSASYDELKAKAQTTFQLGQVELEDIQEKIEEANRK